MNFVYKRITLKDAVIVIIKFFMIKGDTYGEKKKKKKKKIFPI